jgi:hypothetical protein
MHSVQRLESEEYEDTTYRVKEMKGEMTGSREDKEEDK